MSENNNFNPFFIDQNKQYENREQVVYVEDAPQEKKGKARVVVAAFLIVALIVGAGAGGYLINNTNSGGAGVGTTISNGTDNENSDEAFTLSDTKVNPAKTTDGLTPQEVAAKVIPSVVCIQTYQMNNVQAASTGSGIIMSADGYIITNNHVVDGASALKVITYDNETYEAEIVGADSTSDLALIKIDANNLTAATFGNSDNLEVAESVMAIGNPGGLELNSSVTTGIVSAKNRDVASEGSQSMKCIQTNAAINPGNSGGPLVNMNGDVVGINSSKIAATGYEGLGFAININDAQPIISSLKNYGYVKDRAILGITYQVIDEMTASFYRLPSGIIIQSVTSRNAADAGLKKGDVITQVAGQPIIEGTELLAAIKSRKPGDTLPLTIFRDGKTQDVNVVLSEDRGSNSPMINN
jgi:Trypsin-like serine proteases, typically periplasmic, contain C-terminal PDZ domain